ncbi:50S ribosomal protein L25 [Candidatus Uhrbacteria bacterium]|nr:50S ribosomal protein L25 [Candidatus Uhrbacteria bacterium]
MEPITLRAAPRTSLGRRAQRVRGEGNIPAVVYGREMSSTPVTVSGQEFSRAYRAAGESTLLDLAVEGASVVKVLIQEVARHPITGHPIHVDFHAVSMTEKIHTRIPLKFVGVAPAVKEVGGIIVKQFDHVEVDALASALVHEIEVDLTPLARIDDVIRFRDLRVPPGITLKHDPEEIVVSVTEVTEEEVAPTPAAAPASVEVVGAKGKEGTTGEATGAEPKVEEKGKKKEKSKP